MVFSKGGYKSESGVCTDSHTRPARVEQRGLEAGPPLPVEVGPGLGEGGGGENQTKCKKVAAARAERNHSLPSPLF